MIRKLNKLKGILTHGSGEPHRSFKRPRTLVLIAVIYLLLTPVNLILVAVNFKTSTLTGLLSHFSLFSLLLLLTAPVVGVGIFLIRRWGYYAFLLHSVCLILYNIYTVIAFPEVYYLGALVRTVFGLLGLGYFLRREVSSPYLNVVPRGWRHHRREPIKVGVHLDGTRAITRDLSSTGCFVADATGYAPGETVDTRLETDSGEFSFSSRVTRTGSEGTGLQFIGLSRRQKQNITRFLRSRFPVRYALEIPVELDQNGRVHEAKTANLSSDGFFLPLEGALPEPGAVGVKLHLNGSSFAGRGTITWSDASGRFEKPPGVGVRIDRLDKAKSFKRQLKRLSRTAETIR